MLYHRPGERVPVVGTYTMTYLDGRPTGDTRYCHAADRFPPSRHAGVRSRLLVEHDRPRERPSRVAPRGFCRRCRDQPRP